MRKLDKIIELIEEHQKRYTEEDLKWKTEKRKWYWILDKIHSLSIDLHYMDEDYFTKKRIEILKLFLELMETKIKK